MDHCNTSKLSTKMFSKRPHNLIAGNMLLHGPRPMAVKLTFCTGAMNRAYCTVASTMVRYIVTNV